MVEYRIVSREEAMKNVVTRRTRWTEVLNAVRNLPEGQVIEVTLWPNGQELPKNASAYVYNVVATLRQRARNMGMEVKVYRSADGRRVYVERAS